MIVTGISFLRRLLAHLYSRPFLAFQVRIVPRTGTTTNVKKDGLFSSTALTPGNASSSIFSSNSYCLNPTAQIHPKYYLFLLHPKLLGHKTVFELLPASSSYDPSEDGCAKPSDRTSGFGNLTRSIDGDAAQTEVEVDSLGRNIQIGEFFFFSFWH